MTSHFGPLPPKDHSNDEILRFVQQNVNTFYRALSLTDVETDSLVSASAVLGTVTATTVATTALTATTATIGAITATTITASGQILAPTPVSIVKARNQNLSGSIISTTSTVELTCTLAIPATWLTYDIEAIFQGYEFESGTLTAVRTMTHELRLTNEAGTLMGRQISLIGTTAPNSAAICVQGYLTGQTTTGNVVIAYVATTAGDSGQTSWDDGTIIATAYRTS